MYPVLERIPSLTYDPREWAVDQAVAFVSTLGDNASSVVDALHQRLPSRSVPVANIAWGILRWCSTSHGRDPYRIAALHLDEELLYRVLSFSFELAVALSAWFITHPALHDAVIQSAKSALGITVLEDAIARNKDILHTAALQALAQQKEIHRREAIIHRIRCEVVDQEQRIKAKQAAEQKLVAMVQKRESELSTARNQVQTIRTQIKNSVETRHAAEELKHILLKQHKDKEDSAARQKACATLILGLLRPKFEDLENKLSEALAVEQGLRDKVQAGIATSAHLKRDIANLDVAHQRLVKEVADFRTTIAQAERDKPHAIASLAMYIARERDTHILASTALEQRANSLRRAVYRTKQAVSDTKASLDFSVVEHRLHMQHCSSVKKQEQDSGLRGRLAIVSEGLTKAEGKLHDIQKQRRDVACQRERAKGLSLLALRSYQAGHRVATTHSEALFETYVSNKERIAELEASLAALDHG